MKRPNSYLAATLTAPVLALGMTSCGQGTSELVWGMPTDTHEAQLRKLIADDDFTNPGMIAFNEDRPDKAQVNVSRIDLKQLQVGKCVFYNINFEATIADGTFTNVTQYTVTPPKSETLVVENAQQLAQAVSPRTDCYPEK